MTERRVLSAPPLVLDVGDQRAWLSGAALDLGPKPFALLQALMQAPQRLVTKEELFESVWEGRFVSEAVLTTAMRDVRRALADDARAPTFIATAHGKGYRFLLPVSVSNAPPQGLSAPAPSHRPRRWRAHPLLFAAAALVVIVALGLGASGRLTAPAPRALAGFEAIEPASIAVLPFEDLSPESDRAYFVDGLSEEILNALMAVDGLRVASRTSSFAFKERADAPLPDIARQLGVRNVLEGSVRMAEARVRVRVRLVDARADRTLWSRTYERALSVENVYTIQNEVAARVVGELRDELNTTLALPNGRVRGAAAGTTDLRAYEHYLRARELFLARSDLPRALRLARTAVEVDAGFAHGWELLAAVSFVAEGGRATSEGRQAVATALRLNPNLSLAHAINGVMGNLEPPYDWERLIECLETALEFDPRNTTALLWLGTELHKLGYLERSQSLLERCIELDPAYDRCRRHLYWVLHMRGDTERALFEYRRLVREGAAPDEVVLLQALLERGDEAGAREMTASVIAEAPMPEAVFAAMRDPFADRVAARRALRQWVEGVRFRRNIYPVILELGAYDLLLRQQGSNFGLWWPEHSEFRQSSAFRQFVREMEIDDYWRAHGYPPQCRPVGETDFSCA